MEFEPGAINSDTVLLPLKDKIGDVDNLPFKEAALIAKHVDRINFTSYQSNGFLIFKSNESGYKLQLFEGVSGRPVTDYPNASEFEISLSNINVGFFVESLFEKSKFILNAVLQEDLDRRGYQIAAGDSSIRFTLASTNEKYNMAMVNVPEMNSCLFTVCRYESDSKRTGMGNTIVSFDNNSEHFIEFVRKHGQKGIYAFFAVVMSDVFIQSVTKAELTDRQKYLPWAKEIAALQTDLIYKEVKLDELEKYKIKTASPRVKIFIPTRR